MCEGDQRWGTSGIYASLGARNGSQFWSLLVRDFDAVPSFPDSFTSQERPVSGCPSQIPSIRGRGPTLFLPRCYSLDATMRRAAITVAVPHSGFLWLPTIFPPFQPVLQGPKMDCLRARDIDCGFRAEGQSRPCKHQASSKGICRTRMWPPKSVRPEAVQFEAMELRVQLIQVPSSTRLVCIRRSSQPSELFYGAIQQPFQL